ncbi:glycosyltransferase family 4 protein [Facklamia miroungae]|uniref:Glycosyltransferase involved in cell wall bisynthesis n=1 Tax=Facklamia miroungae TaxID=120956 RepID=A0A1G7QQZ9_9LACT|nr:glycosyltransferase family 4 protein [Facklamia miroungae]NKZ29034.1 glycosyltransferase family 4 protein [Facklamia miroungae]SDG00966.1 Glycosyltransferase involved in cell wall bisynthesis [Facklamia miroungae]
MKILHILAQLPGQTGSGVYFQNLIQGLRMKGVLNGVIYANQSPFQYKLQAEYSNPVQFNSKELPFSIVGMSDVMPYPSSVYSQLTDNEIKLWQRAFTKRLNQAKEEFQPDIVICHHLWYLTALVLDLYPDIPVVGISHGTDIRQARRHPHLKQKYLGDMNRLSLIFSLSQENRKNLIKEFAINPEKIKVTGNGFNSEIFNLTKSLNSKKKSIELLFAGKITRSKGVFELVLAFQNVRKKFPQTNLFLIGNGEQTEINELKNIVAQKDIAGIHFLPAVNQLELAEWMKNSDVFILPSYYEGLATICLEAMACGLRLVVSELEPLKNFIKPEINQSGIIEYVPLPTIIDQDQAHEKDIPLFIHQLTQAISLQIERVLNGEIIDPSIFDKIHSYSWQQLINKQYIFLKKLLS